MRLRQSRAAIVFATAACATLLAADPAPSTKFTPLTVHAEALVTTITTKPLSANAPAGRAGLAAQTIVAGPDARLAAVRLSTGGTLTTAALSAYAPGGLITTQSLSAYAPGGTFPVSVAHLSADAPSAGTGLRLSGSIVATSPIARLLVPASGGGTIVTNGLTATAPGGVVTTTSLSAYAPAVTSGRSAGSNGGAIETVSLIAHAPGGAIATSPLSATAPGGTFGVLVAALSADAPAPHGIVGTTVLAGSNPGARLSVIAGSGGGTIPTQSLTANAPGGVITTATLTANAPNR